jgi:6-phospho-beta-glucosidase
MPSAARTPVAIIGGGAYAARLVELVAGVDGLPALALRLHARDPDRLAVVAGHAGALLRRRGARHEVSACRELDAAVDGAAVVILLARVGGLTARSHDEAFPRRYGLVGDEGIGVGGMANAWRTVPVLEVMAEHIAARAPAAHVLNLMAPLGVTSRLLVERRLAAVGLCELPAVTVGRWQARAGAGSPLGFAGLNHLAFFWPLTGAALDHPVLRAAAELGELPASLIERLGAAPLHYFLDVFAADEAARLGRARAPGRADQLAALQRDLIDAFERAPGGPVAAFDRRPTPWFEHALVPSLVAVLGGPPYRAALDLRNEQAGQPTLDEAPAAVVVEAPGVLDGRGARFEPVPARPAAVRALIGRFAHAEDLVYRAAVTRDRALLAMALDALPLAIAADHRAPLVDDIVRSVAPV